MSRLLSVCIPAYNRADLLPDLLSSIVSQEDADFEIVVAEDCSPERDAIRKVVLDYASEYPNLIRYHENPRNIGYDANLRRLIELSSSEYCLFMGNDDLMCPNALSTIASGLSRHQNIGAVMRSYAHIKNNSDEILQVFRYFAEERVFPHGSDTIVTFFRRMVVLPGIVLHRDLSASLATSKFDGSLLYQLYLVGNILAKMDGLFMPEIVTLYRVDGVPDFGNSSAERAYYSPTMQTPASSIHFMTGMLEIARSLEDTTGLHVYEPILRDLSNYSYPFIALQRDEGFFIFIWYCMQLATLGFGRSPWFYCYILGLLLLGVDLMDSIVRFVKKRLGYTPQFGKIYKGVQV